VRSRVCQRDFNYPSSRGSDLRKVEGLVALLLPLRTEDHWKSKVFGIAAGGKL
jgi:hypothetical protein